MKKHSTGALTDEQRAAQDRLYAEHRRYDTVILGTGMAALAAGALLAHRGEKVCMLEAHDRPGGMAHTFTMGEYRFCAQVHYIWGCGPGGAIHALLKKIGLDREITFELLDPEGYDRVSLPDGTMVRIPYGFDRLATNIGRAFPGQQEPVRRFLALLERIHAQIARLPDAPLGWLRMIAQGWRVPALVTHRMSTLQDVLDDCGVSPQAQAVLVANAGDLMAPPRELSIFPYAELMCGYDTGAYYPTRHFHHLVDRLVRFIVERGGAVFLETPVTRIDVRGDRVRAVETADGKVFDAPRTICNIDPQRAAAMIGLEHFPARWHKPLAYTYSPSGVMVYLGLEGLDPREHGFGRFNTWHLEQWSMDRAWDEQGSGDFTRPWVFLATPTLHTADASVVPAGGHILEVATYADYGWFKRMQDASYPRYAHAKQELAERLLDVVEARFIPDLRKHIALKVVGTPVTHEDFCNAPFGNAYGSYFSPAQMGLGRLTADTPFANFWWCNASSGSAGIHGATHTGVSLYMRLTGDRFHDPRRAPPLADGEAYARLTAAARDVARPIG